MRQAQDPHGQGQPDTECSGGNGSLIVGAKMEGEPTPLSQGPQSLQGAAAPSPPPSARVSLAVLPHMTQNTPRRKHPEF